MAHKKQETCKPKKLDYFGYHQEVARAFQTDCDKLLLAFQAKNNLSFKTFAKVWRAMHFSLVFSGQQLVDELVFFPLSCFSIVKKYVIFSDNIYIQTGALYTLYGLYYKQPLSVKVRIRCTAEDWEHLEKLVEKLKQRAVKDGPFIFEKMKLDGAFKIVLFRNKYGPECKFMWQEEPLLGNIFGSIKNGDPTMPVVAVLNSNNFYGLDCISNVTKDYVKRLKKFGFSEKDCEATANFPKEIDALLEKMRSVGSDEASTSSKGNTTSNQLKKKGNATSKQLKKKDKIKPLLDIK